MIGRQLVALVLVRAVLRNSGGRPYCRRCGGVFVCYPDCPTQQSK